MNQGATQEFLSVEIVLDDNISVKDTRVFAGMTNEKKKIKLVWRRIMQHQIGMGEEDH